MFDHQTIDNEPRCVVKGLETDTHWVFRVKAVNSQGTGEPSDSTESILVQEDKGIRFELMMLRS